MFRTQATGLLKFALTGAAMMLAASAVQAEEIAAPAFANDRAFDVAMGRIVQDLSHEQVAVLQLLAHATAAAGLCEGLTLDEGAVHGALVEATHDATSNASDEDMQFHRDFAMIAFGVMVGFAMDRATKDEATFCAAAMKTADDPEENLFLTKLSAEPEGGEEPAQQ